MNFKKVKTLLCREFFTLSSCFFSLAKSLNDVDADAVKLVVDASISPIRTNSPSSSSSTVMFLAVSYR